MEHKSSIYLCVFLSVAFAISYYFILGKRGIHEYFMLQKKIEEKNRDISLVRNEIHELSHTITQCQSDTFEREKMCREKLQLGHADESIYIDATTIKKAAH